MRQGEFTSGRSYVKQLRELDPENPQYAQMAKQIEGGASLIDHPVRAQPGRR